MPASLTAFAASLSLRGTAASVPRALSAQRRWRMSVGQRSSTRTELKQNRLGSSDLLVTEACLGTMTWGVQNTEADAHAQLDYAIKERGINFLDTAEIYPIPTQAPGHISGKTEKYIGSWLAKNPSIRERIVIASKVMGYSLASKHVANRTDPPTTGQIDARLDRESILSACEGSLRRLQTNYIDLYQLHWPDRYAPVWGSRVYNPAFERDEISFEETLGAIKELLNSGKIRAWGLSNETPYGVGEAVRIADKIGLPRPATIQNQFSLLDRRFEGPLAESCAPRHYNIGLLPWSILGGGVLTGKYQGKVDSNGVPFDDSLNDARFVKFRYFQTRFWEPRIANIIAAYQDIADEAGVSLSTLSQKFCATRWYIPSSIIGATNVTQLEENIDAFGVELDDEVLAKIDRVHAENKDPVVPI